MDLADPLRGSDSLGVPPDPLICQPHLTASMNLKQKTAAILLATGVTLTGAATADASSKYTPTTTSASLSVPVTVAQKSKPKPKPKPTLDDLMEDLESQDKLGNFEIQDLS